jgi:hypothetical protein
MAVEKIWSDLEEPCCTRSFADGEAAAWTLHKHAGAYTSITVENRGSGVLFVSRGPAERGATSAVIALTQRATRLQPNEKYTMYLAGTAPKYATPEFSTFGVDGAAHPMGLTFEAS